MALSGLHAICGYVGAPPGPALLGAVAWSQTMAGPGTTTQAAPASSTIAGATGANLAFEVRASVDAYVAIGPTPDAANGPRVFLPANETRDLFCVPGDRLSWIAA